MTTDQNQPPIGDRQGLASLRRRVPDGLATVRGIAIVAALIAVLGVAYAVGSPAGSAPTPGSSPQLLAAEKLAADGASQNGNALRDPSLAYSGTPAGTAGTKVQAGSGTTAGQGQQAAALDATLIVKTGQMSFEVENLDTAVSRAQSAIYGMGGSVAASSRTGSDANASATVTYRLPVARWDDALAELRKLASKIVSEQTGSNDVSSQAIDLDARLGNLKTTESAFQAIMARASAIPDVLAVQQQLSSTQSEIEQLTAERDHLRDQAAMSTVTVTFQLPSETVTTQTTQGWALGSQVDQAAAQLVRIGQGLATMVVWAVIVGVPIGLALLVLLLVLRITRRLLGRGQRRGTTPSASDQAAA